MHLLPTLQYNMMLWVIAEYILSKVAQAVARLAITRMAGGSRPTPDARA